MPYQAANFPIGGREAYVGLLWLYSIIALYAASASLVGVIAVGQATDSFYARLFPVLLLISTVAALVGVVVSRWTARVWVEYAGTAAVIAGLTGYTIAICYVALAVDPNWARLPPALIPVALMVFPLLRLRNILKTVATWRAARRARATGEARTGDARA